MLLLLKGYYLIIDETNVDEAMDVDLKINDDYVPSSNSMDILFWDCPMERCIRQYRRYYDLQSHLDSGKHIFKGTKMVLLDKAKVLFKSLTENDTQRTPISIQNFKTIRTTNDTLRDVLSKGWALATPEN